MFKKIVINLCDYAGTYTPKNEMIIHYHNSTANVKDMLPYAVAGEVWLGSEVCENLFLMYSAKQYQERIDCFFNMGIRVLLAIPELHETHFYKVMSVVNQLRNIEGFIVNDIGTAMAVRREYPDSQLVLGRSFDKTIREIRISPGQICDKYNVEQTAIHKKALDEIHLKLYKDLGVSAIITDSVPFLKTELVANEMQIYLEYPRVMLSQAAICEFSGTKGNNPLHGCRFGCFQYSKRYSLSGNNLIKQGKIIYHKEERMIYQCVDCISGDIHLAYTV